MAFDKTPNTVVEHSETEIPEDDKTDHDDHTDGGGLFC